jgi:anaerobic selenocysteine-containing dehydrogenase
VASNRFGGYCAYNGFHQIIPRAKKRGVKIISIDPVRSRTVAQSDEWIQIKPGTDTALGLAMIHLIINEGLYDKEFVAQWTHGFDRLKEHVKDCSTKWAETITGIPEHVIVDLARRYATIKPSTICDGNGTDMYTSSVDAPRTMAILIGLTGQVEVPGGNTFPPFAVQSVLPTKAPSLESRIWPEMFKLYKEMPFPVVKESLLRNEAYRPRAMIVQHGNPVLIQGNEARTKEALSKLEFLIVNDIFPTATTEIADLVLPSASDFEQYNYRGYSSYEGGVLALGRPVADPPGVARSVFEVEYELAQRMEIHQDYPFHDSRSWLEYMLKPTGVTVERLEKEQIVYATPPNQYQKYLKNGFNTPTRKFEFYCETFARNGYNALPSYSEGAGEPMASSLKRQQAFPLLGTSRRPGEFVHTKFRHIDALTRPYPNPLVWIHPQDAQERKIRDDDEVEIMSSRGRITIKARVFEDTMKGLVMVDFGWGNPTDKKGNINVLTTDEFWDPVSGGTPNRLFSCEVMKKSS